MLLSKQAKFKFSRYTICISMWLKIQIEQTSSHFENHFKINIMHIFELGTMRLNKFHPKMSSGTTKHL